jgi:hypothetical protein
VGGCERPDHRDRGAVWVGDWHLAARIARSAAEFGARTGDAHVALTARALVSAAT